MAESPLPPKSTSTGIPSHAAAAPAPVSLRAALHARLMPDYNPRATAYWWALTVTGGLVVPACLVSVLQGPPQQILITAGAVALAVAAAVFPVRVPGTKLALVPNAPFLFLLLLMQGPDAAALAAAAEAAVGSARVSKRWTSRLASPASAALSMVLAGALLHAVLPQGLPAASFEQIAPLLLAAMAAAVAYCFVSASLLAGCIRLKMGEPWLQVRNTVQQFGWVSLAYAGSAVIATLLLVAHGQAGSAVLWVMVPLLAMFLLALHYRFREQEQAAQTAAATQKHLEELRASEQRFQLAFTHASIGMLLMRFDGRVMQANAALGELLGRAQAELTDQPFVDFVHAEDHTPFTNLVRFANEEHLRTADSELRCIGPDGGPIWVALHCSTFTEPGTNQPCLILQVQDITARRLAEERLQHRALHDPLTGLPNQRRFDECLSGVLTRAEVKRGGPQPQYAVLYLDFDRYRNIYDSLGQRAGDELVVQVARRLQTGLRPHDILARVDGDEFVVLTTELADPQHAVVLAQRLLELMADPFIVGKVELTSTTSVGIVLGTSAYSDPQALLADAKTAMYRAKGSGRERYAVFDGVASPPAPRRLHDVAELRRALAEGELQVVYQPMQRLNGAALVGFEALLRWHHPADGVLSPAAFLPLAEAHGLMPQVGDFVLTAACRQMAQWQQLDPAFSGLTMSVNISASELAESGFVPRVRRALLESGLKASCLCLELSEHALLQQLDTARGKVLALSQLGVRWTLDDFGTGVTSLAHLSRLPIDALKIDSAFIARLPGRPADAAVVQAIVQLGHTLRKGVVAEGVKYGAQADALRAMGCESGQGFHLGAPLSATDASAALMQGRTPPVH